MKLSILLVCTFTLSAFGYQIPKEVKEKYAYLNSIPILAQPDGSRGLGEARHYIRRGIHVLYLVGDRYEMAYQHGRLLQDEIHKGALSESAKMLKNAVLNNLGNIPVISTVVINNFYRNISDSIFEAGQKQAVETGLRAPLMDAYGLSEGANISMDDVVYGAMGPESLLVLLGQNLDKDAAVTGGEPSACSSFIAKDSATRRGEMILGRNTDFPLNGYYDRYPTVFYFNPTDGTQKYMAVVSAGLHNAGVVGMNESGLILFNHTVPTKEVSAQGLPVFMVGQEVLRSAHTLEEALKMFSKFRSAAGWNYLIVSTKERKAVTLEMSNQRQAVYPMQGDWHVQTNHYRSQEMLSAYESLNVSTDTDTKARAKRMGDMIQAKRGNLDARAAMAIMGDKFDPINQEVRGLMNTVGVHNTMTSIVVRPESKVLYVANGQAPVSQTEYVELPLVGSATLDSLASTSYEVIPNNRHKIEYPRLAEAEQLFIQAKIAFESEIDYPKSLSLLEKVVALDSSSPGYLFNYSAVALKAGEYAKANDGFQKLTQVKQSHYVYLGYYYLGRIQAQQGDKAGAKAWFEKLIAEAAPGGQEEKLVAAAQKALDRCSSWIRPYRIHQMDLPLMLQQADMIKY